MHPILISASFLAMVLTPCLISTRLSQHKPFSDESEA